MDPDQIRNILNILFMVLFIVAVVVYFAVDNEPIWFVYICGAAIVIKIVEVFIRFTKR